MAKDDMCGFWNVAESETRLLGDGGQVPQSVPA